MIDLIIPAYNAEDTIGRALASVAAQTKQRKFLVTVVDDCSTDATAAIVQKFKGIIPLQYIKLEKNLGKPGLVRNEGIKKTRCPYIMFLDSDDMLTPMAGELLSRAATQHRPDVIIGSFYGENEEAKEKDRYSIYGSKHITWLHGNLYKRDYLKENNIEFDHRMNEDGSFNMKCVNFTDNIYHIEVPLAIWCNNKKSLTRSEEHFMLNISLDYIETYADAIKEILSRRPQHKNNIDFKNTCAYKLGEFFEFIEANYYYNKPTEELLTKVNNYVTLLKENNMLNKDLLRGANEYFNSFKVFPHILRQHTITDFFDILEIEYKECFNG